MSEIRTSLGEVYSLERRLPPMGWKPKRRGVGDLTDALDLPDFGGGDDLGILAIIGIAVFAIVAVLVLIPLLLFVAEVALVVALVIPITIAALVLGVKQHTVLLALRPSGKVVDRRDVRGLYGSIKAGRELTSAAHAGAYRH